MSDDDVGIDREREATLVNIGRQPSVYFSKQRGACTLTRFADCAAQRRTGEVTEYKLVRRRVAERLYGRANGDVFEIRIADESTQLVRVAEAKAPEVIGPAASGPIWRASASAATANPRLRSIGPYTLRISLPPAGSSTLCISRSEAGRSGKNCRPD